MLAARDELDKIYVRAIRDCTRTGHDVQANSLKSEREEFRSKSVPIIPYRRTPGNFVPEVPASLPPPIQVNRAILIHSEWNFTRRANDLNQGGAFKILDGVIYHLNASDPVGLAASDGAGQLHLEFYSHRKIAGGEATVQRVAEGEWRGVLDFDGMSWEFQMSRR